MDADRVRTQLLSMNVEDVRQNESMAHHTTWRIGGPADILVSPKCLDDLRAVMRCAKQWNLPMTFVGRGSNMLVQDGGIRGIVILMHDGFSDIRVDGHRLIAQAGRSFVSVAAISVKNGLTGLEFASGIPGSVGGAVMMNAGAHGGEVKDVLVYADVMDADGEVQRLTNADLKFSYRYSVLKDNPMLVVEAAFDLVPGEVIKSQEQMRQWSQRRSSTQPLSMPNCGSVFRNPEGTHAARLIEEAGLKGMRHGGAQVSEKHANFIVNLGGASASDVLWLIHHVQETVKAQFGIALETEVRVVGELASGR